jgi:hypothetical protein
MYFWRGSKEIIIETSVEDMNSDIRYPVSGNVNLLSYFVTLNVIVSENR